MQKRKVLSSSIPCNWETFISPGNMCETKSNKIKQVQTKPNNYHYFLFKLFNKFGLIIDFLKFWQFLRQSWGFVTFETLTTILTIENLNSWQSLLSDNQEWHWTAFAILAMFFPNTNTNINTKTNMNFQTKTFARQTLIFQYVPRPTHHPPPTHNPTPLVWEIFPLNPVFFIVPKGSLSVKGVQFF